jgi:anthranilate synthase/aminodeoxychorismate synthase-like glutamine amidotransferase
MEKRPRTARATMAATKGDGAIARFSDELRWLVAGTSQTGGQRLRYNCSRFLKMILLLDNYDSFTYNLAQYLGQMGQTLEVRRNDKITLDEIEMLEPERIVISPGPCTPKEAGVSVPLIERFAGKIPILGVCLGHQAIGAAFGGNVIRAKEVMHGKTSEIHHDGKTVFRGLPQNFPATRYHSLIVERKSLPKSLEISAETEDGTIMGLRHRKMKVEGVQFHPESVLTDAGFRLLENFLSI